LRHVSPGDPALDQQPAVELGIVELADPSLDLARTAGQGVIAAVTTQGALAVTGILQARDLGPANRGLLALVTLVPIILALLGTLGLPISATYALARDPRILRPIVTLLRKVILIQCAVLIPVCAAVSFAVVSPSGGTSSVAATAFAIGITPALLAHEYMVAILQGARLSRTYYVLRVLPSLLWLVAMVTAAVLDQLTVVTASLSCTLSYAITAAIGAICVYRLSESLRGGEERPPPPLLTLVKFGMRGLIGTTPIMSTYRLDQAIVGLFLTTIALGHYVVAISFTNLPLFIALSIGAMAYADIAHQRQGAEAKHTVWRYFWITTSINFCIVTALWFICPWLLPALFGEEFRSSVPITQILLVNALLVSAQRVMIECTRGLGRPGLGSLSEIALLVSLLPLSAILVPAHGVIGLSWALVIASAIGFGVSLLGVFTGPRQAL
jgi:O-antigen/teichoic acid export membrane protein